MIDFNAKDIWIKKNKDEPNKFERFIDDISKNNFENLIIFLRGKFYVLNDILLIKNKGTYKPPYMLEIIRKNTYMVKPTRDEGIENLNIDNRSFIDNIYNYLLPEEMFKKSSLFPLLFQYRILQFFQISGHYSNINHIEKDLVKLGYKTIFFKSIIDNLHNSKFLKIKSDNVNDGNSYEYDITNRGRLVINKLALNLEYIEHVVPSSRLPKLCIKNIKQYSPYSSLSMNDVIMNGIHNDFYFLNIIRDIELKERNNNKKLADKIRIQDKILNNIRIALNHKLSARRLIFNNNYEYETYLDKILTIIETKE